MYVTKGSVVFLTKSISETHLSCDHCFVFLRKPLNLKGGRNHKECVRVSAGYTLSSLVEVH